MMLPTSFSVALQKAAFDAGFEIERSPEIGWRLFESAHTQLKIWLRVEDGAHVAAFSRVDVDAELEAFGRPWQGSLPLDAQVARTVNDGASLYRLLVRAFQLSRALPTAPLESFLSLTCALPRATKAERLVIQRIGQNTYRTGLMEYWEGRCAVTGLDEPALLRASHAKPWADCETDAERLDVFNGFLLAAHLDAAFDAGLITVTEDGAIQPSPLLGAYALTVLGLDRPRRVARLATGHGPYLEWHRAKVFERK